MAISKANFVLIIVSILLVSSFFFSEPIILHAPRIRLWDSTSSNWSGYADYKSTFTNVQGSWTVPQPNCGVTPNAYSSYWIGMDGYNTGTVEQIGTDSDCNSGNAKYYAWFEMYPKPGFLINNMNINPGDQMSAQVKYVGGNKYALTLTDMTSGKSFSTTQSLNAARSSAEWVVEAPSSSTGILPLADYGTATFTSASANGNLINSFTYDAINMVDPYGMTSTVSSLSNGNSFTATWNQGTYTVKK